MRLDISPALMFSCQFSKLVKKHLIICHKSGMFDDGAICPCDSVRGSLCHLFQSVIPVSFFPFLGCGIFPDDVGQRDTGYPITLVEEFINSIKSLWSISLINHGGLGVIPIAIWVTQLPDGVDGLDCPISRVTSLRDLLRVLQGVCCKLNIHFNLLTDQMSQIGSPVIMSSCTFWAFDILTQCLHITILQETEIIQGINALVLHHCLGSACTAPKVLKICSHACLHHFFTFLYLGFLPALGKIYDPIAEEFQVPFGVPTYLQMLIRRFGLMWHLKNLILSYTVLMLHNVLHSLRFLLLGRNLWVLGNIGWSLPKYCPILLQYYMCGIALSILLEKFMLRSQGIPQIFWCGVPPFLVLLLSTDCQKVTLPQVGMSKI